MTSKPLANILIIDNDEAVTRAISTRLGTLGYRCVTALTGAQGMAQFSQWNIDLVITDLIMPELDGVGLVERIRRISEVPIIVVTGFRDCVARVRRMSGTTVLEKPFESDALVDLVEAELAVRNTSTTGDAQEGRRNAAVSP